MIRYFHILVAIFLSSSLIAQNATSNDKCASYLHPELNKQVYKFVDQMPSFPGGDGEMAKYLAQNVKYQNTDEVSDGKVIIYFIVSEDGSILNAKIKNQNAAREITSFEKQALEVVQSMPKWTPGNCDGTSVPVEVIIPIQINLK